MFQHVPIFLAITNLYHAILVFLIKKNELNNVSLRVCGSTGVFGTVIIIVICNSTSENTSPLLWLFAHIIFNLLYYLYLYKINLDISYTTQIYYRNFFSVILLFPISLYLDVLHLPSNRGWEFYAGCFSSGVLGTFLQVWTFKISTQPNHLQIECLAKVICSVIAYKIFFADIQKLTWVLVILNFLICAIFLKSTDQKTRNVKSEINLSLPPSHIRKSDSDLMLLV